MRRAAFAVALLLAATGSARPSDFASTMPDGVADVSGWELVSGDFDTPGFRGDYRFYVNPRLQALYQVMRYHTSTSLAPGEPLGAERVAFVRRPGRASRCCAGSGSRPERCRRGARSHPAAGVPVRDVDADARARIHRAASLARER